MKTYNDLIIEFSPTDYVPDVLLPSSMKKFKKNYKNIERMFPGVSQFLSVANRYVLRGNRYKNKDLKRLLKRIKKRPDISDMNKRDLKYVYEFINKYKLYNVESIRNIFNDYSDFSEKQQNNKPE